MLVDVVFNLPLERSFHYVVPASLRGQVQRGVRVVAPFGPRERVGFVVEVLARSAVPAARLRPIRRVLDAVPVITGERWDLARWLTAYDVCSLGEALAAMVPTALRLRAAAGPAAASSGGVQGPALTAHQRRAMQTIEGALSRGGGRTVLVHGVTASGKTELYLQAIARVLAGGRTAIYLVPEIALTPQSIDRVRERFGEAVAVWHSRLTNRQRAQAWQALSDGSFRVVLGTRSAVFAPLARLGLIILDEEHEATYKQEDAPRYHAREVARERARLADAVVLLGSATPAVESYARAQAGRDDLVTLPERIEGRPLPAVEVVDLREELASRRRLAPLSARLERLLHETVERGEQAMLLLNRRGFARALLCRRCGAVVRCRRCTVPLIYHAAAARLRCHYCSFEQEPPSLCPACGKDYLRLRGSGTERVESELHRLFPAGRISRMDLDTTRTRESHREVYEAVRRREVGLLVGTQMIAKGFDFPQVTLVGIVSADTALNLPDFRAGERTFDLLTQMAGRAGRGRQPGRVVIQTFCPSHYAIRAAAEQDYARFVAQELAMRKRLRLPPYAQLVQLTLRGSRRDRVYAAAAALADRLRRAAGRRRIEVLGPAPHRVPRRRRAFWMCVLLKGPRVEPMVELVRGALQPGRKFQGMPVIVDVDPL